MMLTRKVINALVVVTGFGLAGCSGKENPVTSTGGPATSAGIPGKPAVDHISPPAADMSTPKTTLIAFGKAIEAGDVAAAKTLTISDPKSDKLLEAFVPIIPAMKHLSEAAQKKFGEAGKGIGGNENKEFNIAKDVESAQITETGDTATATMPNDKGKDPLKLKKINGQWKIDFVSSMGKQAKPEDLDKISPMFTGLAKAANEGATDIEAGKYKTAKEAKEAVDMKMAGALLGGMADLMKDAGKNGGAGNPFGGAGGPGSPMGGAPGSSGGR